ncbi:MAG: hypothetical protein ABSD97_04920 [Acidimicrobiales bacterium]|jgi:hypothetical protein
MKMYLREAVVGGPGEQQIGVGRWCEVVAAIASVLSATKSAHQGAPVDRMTAFRAAEGVILERPVVAEVGGALCAVEGRLVAQELRRAVENLPDAVSVT